MLFVFVVACGGGGDDEPATPSRCEQMRDHLIELRLASVTQDQAAHRAALQRAIGADVVTACNEMTDAQVGCVLDAHDPLEAAVCTPEQP